MKNVNMLTLKSYSFNQTIHTDCAILACPEQEQGRGYKSFSTKRNRRLKNGVITFDTF